jgi:hypothetical protein
MSDILYNIWCEFDIGQEDLLFTSKDNAITWLHKNEILGELGDTYEDLEQEGLIGFTEMRIHS